MNMLNVLNELNSDGCWAHTLSLYHIRQRRAPLWRPCSLCCSAASLSLSAWQMHVTASGDFTLTFSFIVQHNLWILPLSQGHIFCYQHLVYVTHISKTISSSHRCYPVVIRQPQFKHKGLLFIFKVNLKRQHQQLDKEGAKGERWTKAGELFVHDKQCHTYYTTTSSTSPRALFYVPPALRETTSWKQSSNTEHQ